MTNPTTTSVIDLASASFDDNEATFVPAANRKSRQAASPATSTNTSSDAVLLIPVDRVRVLKNVRATLDKKGIEQLATSIRNEGQLAPIVVQKLDDDSYGIVFGHRRHAAIALNAAKHNGHGLVRCTVRNNVKAEDLAFIQLACRSTRSCCSSHTIPHGEKQRQRFSRQVLPTSRRPTSRRALLLSSAQLVTGRSNSSQTASSAATRRHPTNQQPHSKTPPSPHTASPRTSTSSTADPTVHSVDRGGRSSKWRAIHINMDRIKQLPHAERRAMAAALQAAPINLGPEMFQAVDIRGA